MTVVRNTARDAAGGAAARARVSIRLVAGTGTNVPGYTDDGTVVAAYTVVAGSDGAWSVDLPANSTLTPADTYYEVTERPVGGSVHTHSIEVPASGGPYDLPSVLAVPPPEPGSLGASLDDLAAEAAARAAADTSVASAAATDATSKANAAQAAAIAASNPLALGATRSRRPPISSWVTIFASGHGFTNFASTAAAVADDTADYALGSQSLAVTTKSDGSLSGVQKTGITAIDATGKSLVLVAKITDVTNVNSMIIYAGTNDFSWYYQWTIMDNGGSGQQFFKSGEYVFITLSFGDAATVGSVNRSAITALRLRIGCTNGNSTVIRWQGVGLTAEQATWPNGVISISFDDSLATQFNNARPKLDQYGFPATAYLIVDVLGQTNYMTLSQCRQLEDVSGWDVAAHSWTLADHDLAFTNLTSSQLASNLSQMRNWLETNGFRGSRHLAFPQGAFNSTVLSVVRRYFDSARTVIRRTKNETVPPGDPMRLRSASLINSDMPASIWTAAIDTAYTNKSWLHLTFHQVVAANPGITGILQSDFDTIIDYIATKGTPVRTVREVLSGL